MPTVQEYDNLTYDSDHNTNELREKQDDIRGGDVINADKHCGGNQDKESKTCKQCSPKRGTEEGSNQVRCSSVDVFEEISCWINKLTNRGKQPTQTTKHKSTYRYRKKSRSRKLPITPARN